MQGTAEAYEFGSHDGACAFGSKPIGEGEIKVWAATRNCTAGRHGVCGYCAGPSKYPLDDIPELTLSSAAPCAMDSWNPRALTGSSYRPRSKMYKSTILRN